MCFCLNLAVVVVDPCEGVNCNHGTCDNGVCTCTTGYEGTFCDTITDNCLVQDCSNRGVCVNAVAAYSCTCNLGYEGTDCETIIEWCTRNSVTCYNDGVCSNTADNTGWECECVCGYSGTNCAAQLCYDGTFCQNHGTCG